MLGRLIRNIRNKPKAIRDQYAFWVAVTVTGVVVLVWLFGLTSRVDQMSTPKNTDESQPAFGSILDELRERFSSVSEVTEQLSDTPTPEVAPDETILESLLEQVEYSDDQAVSASTSVPLSSVRAIRIATTTASTTQ